MEITDYFLRNELINKLGPDNFALFLQAENEENFKKDMEEQQKREHDKNGKSN